MTVVDDNQNYVALANIDGLTTAQSLKVDATTGALLLEIGANTITSPVVINRALIEENRESVSQAYNGSTYQPLLIDATSGYLLIDIV